MSQHAKRIAAIERAERQAMEKYTAAIESLAQWIAANCCQADQDAFYRWVKANGEMPELAQVEKQGVTWAEFEKRLQEIGEPQAGDDAVLDAIYARLPNDLLRRLAE